MATLISIKAHILLYNYKLITILSFDAVVMKFTADKYVIQKVNKNLGIVQVSSWAHYKKKQY